MTVPWEEAFRHVKPFIHSLKMRFCSRFVKIYPLELSFLFQILLWNIFLLFPQRKRNNTWARTSPADCWISRVILEAPSPNWHEIHLLIFTVCSPNIYKSSKNLQKFIKVEGIAFHSLSLSLNNTRHMFHSQNNLIMSNWRI